MYYLALDTETGGIGSDKSLLTAYFGILDQDFQIIDQLSLDLIPDDGIYHVDPNGLAINGINLIDLAKKAITYKNAGTQLYQFLNKSIVTERFTAIGHGIFSDINRIKTDLISEGSWYKFVNYGYLDTIVIAEFLKTTGNIPPNLSSGAESLAGYFGVHGEISGKPHEARYDALTSVLCLRKMINQVIYD